MEAATVRSVLVVDRRAGRSPFGRLTEILHAAFTPYPEGRLPSRTPQRKTRP